MIRADPHTHHAGTQKSPALLRLEHINAGYTSSPVLRDLSMEVHDGEIVSLIGANGAGKSTTLNTISGLLHPSQGTIAWRGRQIGGLSPDNVVRSGIVQVPEGRRVFPTLSIRENLMMGAYTRRIAAEIQASLEQVFDLFPTLKERSGQMAGALSGGQQQMLAIGRAIMSGPSLLMLDEPSMGLSPLLVQQIFDLIQRLKRPGLSILLVEQNANVALSVADRGYVLERGAIVLTGSGQDLLGNEKVQRAYLGL